MISPTRGVAILLLAGAALDEKEASRVSRVQSDERKDTFLSLRTCSPLPGANDDSEATLSPCDQLFEANAAYERGDVDDALDKWRAMIASDDDGPAWYAAVTNCGGALVACKRYADAIPVLMRLIENDATYHESLAKGPIGGFGGRQMSSAVDGYICQHSNDWYYACQKLSDCHESLGNLGEAYRFAVLARHSYQFSAWCGTSVMSMQMGNSERIERLEQAMNDRDR